VEINYLIPARERSLLKKESWFGFGLRNGHFDFWQRLKDLPFLEITTDNFMAKKGGLPFQALRQLSKRKRVFAHSVGMNIGGTCPLDMSYLQEIKDISDWLKPALISDHLCFCYNDTIHSHSLLPICKTKFNLERIATRVHQIQQFLLRPIALENIAASIWSQDDEFTDLEFLNQLSNLTGSGILLDITNLFITCSHQDRNPLIELRKVQPKNVWQYHIAGFSQTNNLPIDTHDRAVDPRVAKLFKKALAVIGKRPTILERDDDHSIDQLLENRSQCLRDMA
jgi:uncharacterized protein (UPF0276 family)